MVCYCFVCGFLGKHTLFSNNLESSLRFTLKHLLVLVVVIFWASIGFLALPHPLMCFGGGWVGGWVGGWGGWGGWQDRSRYGEEYDLKAGSTENLRLGCLKTPTLEGADCLG